MYEKDAYTLLCVSAIRKLSSFDCRNGQHATEARKACRAWIADLRTIRTL